MTLGQFVTIVISFFGESRLKVRLMEFSEMRLFCLASFGSFAVKSLIFAAERQNS
jgi:hypothetical protein